MSKSRTKNLKVNTEITAKEVRLLNEQKELLGVVLTQDALTIANNVGLDLVEIAPTASPPVCQVLSYEKYKFNQEKKNKEQKKLSRQKKDKEVRLKPMINDHDLQFKANHIRKFLIKGLNVKVSVWFRGREMAHIDRGSILLNKVLGLLGDNYTIGKPPKMQGRTMYISLRPCPKKEKR